MKISFSTAAFAALDFQAAAGLAERCGYDGVELIAARDVTTPSNALLTAPSKIRQIFSDSNIEICDIHIGSDFSQIPPRVALAAELRCHFIKIKADSLFGRTDTISPAMIDHLISFGDVAAESNVTLLIENQAVVGSALRLWHLLDRLNHPAIACCWNTLSAAIAKDPPAVAVPTLNSRIRFADLQDAKGLPLTRLTRCEFGEGELPLRKTIDRLRGIGFRGYLRLGFAETVMPGISEIEKQLNAARAVLQRWKILDNRVNTSVSSR